MPSKIFTFDSLSTNLIVFLKYLGQASEKQQENRKFIPI